MSQSKANQIVGLLFVLSVFLIFNSVLLRAFTEVNIVEPALWTYVIVSVTAVIIGFIRRE